MASPSQQRIGLRSYVLRQALAVAGFSARGVFALGFLRDGVDDVIDVLELPVRQGVERLQGLRVDTAAFRVLDDLVTGCGEIGSLQGLLCAEVVSSGDCRTPSSCQLQLQVARPTRPEADVGATHPPSSPVVLRSDNTLAGGIPGAR